MITIDYWDDDGDLAFTVCQSREEAIEKASELTILRLPIIGWYFTTEEIDYDNKEWYPLSELIVH